MRPTIAFLAVLAAFLCVPAAAWPQQTQQKPSQTDQQTAALQAKAANAANQQQTPTTPTDSLAEAARKARAAEKNAPKARVFTNDNIPTAGGVSEVGSARQTSADSEAAPNGQGKGPAKPAAANSETAWRARFSKLRHKLQQDQAELDIMQRELGVLNVQYYSDPNKAMQQQLSREDIQKKTAAIEAKKKQVTEDQQAISDAEDDLRKAGGDPGWANSQ